MSKKSDELSKRFAENINQTVAPRSGVAPAASDRPPDREGAVMLRSFGHMPVDAIVCGPQPRTEFDQVELERLADSIKRFGQLAPIRVRHDAEQGKWVVLVGERRLRACCLAGLERVRVEFVERAMGEADVLAEQVVENAVRADLKPVEQARAYDRLMTLNGWTAQDVADTLGIEPTSVYRSLGLLRLDPEVAEKLDAGEIKATAGYEISKLQSADDQVDIAKRVVAGKLGHEETVALVSRRKARSKTSKRKRRPAARTFKGPRGVVVQAKGKLTDADIAADLREIAARLDSQASNAA